MAKSAFIRFLPGVASHVHLQCTLLNESFFTNTALKISCERMNFFMRTSMSSLFKGLVAIFVPASESPFSGMAGQVDFQCYLLVESLIAELTNVLLQVLMYFHVNPQSPVSGVHL